MNYYFLVVGGGEIENYGPFDSEEERDEEARSYAEHDMFQDAMLYKVKVEPDGEMTTGVYLEGELGEDDIPDSYETVDEDEEEEDL